MALHMNGAALHTPNSLLEAIIQQWHPSKWKGPETAALITIKGNAKAPCVHALGVVGASMAPRGNCPAIPSSCLPRPHIGTTLAGAQSLLLRAISCCCLTASVVLSRQCLVSGVSCNLPWCNVIFCLY
jgi:hypothetical protein